MDKKNSIPIIHKVWCPVLEETKVDMNEENGVIIVDKECRMYHPPSWILLY
jgi:hypothetical protein